MNVLGRIVAVAAIAFVLPVHAKEKVNQGAPTPPAAVGGTMALLYLVPGVQDNGGASDTGIATNFQCTNASTVTEQLQIVVRDTFGAVVGNVTATVGSAHTYSASTHFTVVIAEDNVLSAGINLLGGQALIFATSQFVFCSAMFVDAAATTPQGISLHMVRFGGGVGGSQE